MLRRFSAGVVAAPLLAASLKARASAAASACAVVRGCSTAGGPSTGTSAPAAKSAGVSAGRPGQREPSVNCVTLVGVVHDIQSGFVFEDAVTQFTLTTTSLDTTNQTQDCVVEKDHHTVRCFGDVFSQEVRTKLSEGTVVCVNGRLRLNPQMEPSCSKYYYFPYIQVQPPHGQVSVVYTDRRAAPAPTSPATGELNNGTAADDKGDANGNGDKTS